MSTKPNRKMPPIHPGVLLKDEVVGQMNVPVTLLASILGVERVHAHRVLNGAFGITPKMAVRLAEFLGTTAGVWLDMQAKWDIWQARTHAPEERAIILRQINEHITTHETRRDAHLRQMVEALCKVDSTQAPANGRKKR